MPLFFLIMYPFFELFLKCHVSYNVPFWNFSVCWGGYIIGQITVPTLGYLGWTKQNVVELANYAINHCFNMSLGEILKLHNKILSIWRFRIFLVHARNSGVLRDTPPPWIGPFERGASQTKCGFDVLWSYHTKAPWVCFFRFYWGGSKSGALHAWNSGVLRSNAPLHWLCQQSYHHQTKLGTTSHYHVNITFWLLDMADWLHIYLILLLVISSTDLARISPAEKWPTIDLSSATLALLAVLPTPNQARDYLTLPR